MSTALASLWTMIVITRYARALVATPVTRSSVVYLFAYYLFAFNQE